MERPCEGRPSSSPRRSPWCCPSCCGGALSPGSLGAAADDARVFLVDRFGWFYLLTATALLVGVVALAASRFGRVRLGGDDEQPEFSTLSWFSMLFSAGMGIGLVFWGVAEPVSHFTSPATAEAGGAEAARDALTYSFFHWGLHPWAIYSVLALALAYARYRRGWKATISGALRPVLGDRADGPVGSFIDTLAVVATVFGVATSLGLGAAQINGGLASVFPGVDISSAVQLAVIAVVTLLFLASALTGIHRGIKWLSLVNITLAVAIFTFVLVTASTGRLVGAFTTTLGSYLSDLPVLSLQAGPFDEARHEFINGWTVFYWAWWISWSPFVATFIARISRGRTVREFVVGVLAVPTLVSGLWFSVFGAAGILAEQDGAGLSELATESQLFGLFDTLPLGLLASVAAMVLIVTFFITSADSATFVLGSLSTRDGADPARPVTVVWGLVISASAAVLLVSGGLQGLQTASIVAAFPFAVVLLVTLVALVKGLRSEPTGPGTFTPPRPPERVPVDAST
ncbi:MAG: BCCT family transporter [Actinomycetes bacterium]